MAESKSNIKLENELLALLVRINRAKEWSKENLLKLNEYDSLIADVRKLLNSVLNNNDSKLGREYDKEKGLTRWINFTPDGYVRGEIELNIWKSYIERTLEQLGMKQPANQLVIPAGEYFTARSALRSILSNAKASIFIFDEYLDSVEILPILEPYVAAGIKIKLIKAAPNNDFKSDLGQMRKQYGDHIFLRDIVTLSHDRFIILDENQVYTTGSSLKNLGNKLTVISKIEPSEAAKCISTFDSLWSKARVIY